MCAVQRTATEHCPLCACARTWNTCTPNLESPNHAEISWFNVEYSYSSCHGCSAWGPELTTETVIVDDTLKWARQDVFLLLHSRFKAWVFPPKCWERETAYNILQEPSNDIIQHCSPCPFQLYIFAQLHNCWITAMGSRSINGIGLCQRVRVTAMLIRRDKDVCSDKLSQAHLLVKCIKISLPVTLASCLSSIFLLLFGWISVSKLQI